MAMRAASARTALIEEACSGRGHPAPVVTQDGIEREHFQRASVAVPRTGPESGTGPTDPTRGTILADRRTLAVLFVAAEDERLALRAMEGVGSLVVVEAVLMVRVVLPVRTGLRDDHLLPSLSTSGEVSAGVVARISQAERCPLSA